MVDGRAPSNKRAVTIDGNGATIHGKLATIHGSGGKALPTAIAAEIGRLGKRVSPTVMQKIKLGGGSKPILVC
jgi:hypothetical protein